MDLGAIKVPNTWPDVFAGVPSVNLSVGLEFAPTNGLTLTPSAANVVFTPASLTYTSTDFHKEFTFVASQQAQFNSYPNQVGDLNPTVVRWTLGGPDAGWYKPIPTKSLNVLPRMFFFSFHYFPPPPSLILYSSVFNIHIRRYPRQLPCKPTH